MADTTYTAGLGNGGAHSHTNGRSPAHKIGLESLGFTIAEGVQMLTSLGVVAVADQVAPGVISDVSKTLGKIVVQPLLDPIEATMGALCKLEECKKNDQLTREQRAEQIAKVLVVFGASWAAGFIAKVQTRRGLNKAFGVAVEETKGHWWEFWKLTRKEKIIMLSDEGVHYGALLLANTAAAGPTDDMIRASTNMLVKCGMPKEKAHELAAYTMIWEVPNFLGLAAGLGGIYATHKYPGALGIKNGNGNGTFVSRALASAAEGVTPHTPA